MLSSATLGLGLIYTYANLTFKAKVLIVGATYSTLLIATPFLFCSTQATPPWVSATPKTRVHKFVKKTPLPSPPSDRAIPADEPIRILEWPDRKHQYRVINPPPPSRLSDWIGRHFDGFAALPFQGPFTLHITNRFLSCEEDILRTQKIIKTLSLPTLSEETLATLPKNWGNLEMQASNEWKTRFDQIANQQGTESTLVAIAYDESLPKGERLDNRLAELFEKGTPKNQLVDLRNAFLGQTIHSLPPLQKKASCIVVHGTSCRKHHPQLHSMPWENRGEFFRLSLSCEETFIIGPKEILGPYELFFISHKIAFSFIEWLNEQERAFFSSLLE